MAEIPQSLNGAVDLSGLGKSANRPDAPAPGTPGNGADAPAGDVVATLPDVVIEGGQADLERLAPLSAQVPLLVEMYSAAVEQTSGASPLSEAVRAAQGRLLLLRINLDADPALGNQSQTVLILGGRPAPLFDQVPPREQVLQVMSELLAVAAQQGMTGRVEISGEAPDEAPASAPLPPLHQEAADALATGDIAAARDAYARALDANPSDDNARIGLARVGLLERLRGKTLAEIRDRAAANPEDLDAQLDVADLDVSGGHVVDAFERLLGLFSKADADEKTRIRERLLELFDIVGAADQRVVRARAQLTNLLFS